MRIHHPWDRETKVDIERRGPVTRLRISVSGEADAEVKLDCDAKGDVLRDLRDHNRSGKDTKVLTKILQRLNVPQDLVKRLVVRV